MRPTPLFAGLALASALALAGEAAAPKDSAAAQRAAPPSIAVVNGRRITLPEFDQALSAAVRSRFYHRTPPEGQLAAVRREVADGMVDLALVAGDAKKRGIAVDAAQVDAALDRIESRFKAMPGWEAQREAQRSRWRADLEERALAEALEKQVRAAVAPTEAQVRAHYDANPGTFTEPEKLHLGLILLKVDPSSPREAREKAREEAAAIHARLTKGADFAELAKIHSSDESAAKGGDMGYVHRGMLPEPVQGVVDSLKNGAVSEPVAVLEGIALIRMVDRKAPALRAFPDVRERATELLRRQKADEAWKAFVARLRTDATIEFDPVRYPEVAQAGADETPKAPPAR